MTYVRLRRLKKNRHHRVILLDMTDQCHTSIKYLLVRSFVLMLGESDIRDYAEQVILILLIHVQRIIVVGGKKNLWSGPLADIALLLIDGFCKELVGLHQNKPVKLREICRIIPDRVFNKQNCLYTNTENIVLGILKVLEQLYDRYDQVGISMPAEHVIDC